MTMPLLSLLELREPWLLLAIAAPIVAMLWSRRSRRRPRAVKFQPFALLDGTPLPKTWRTRLVALPCVLEFAALAALAVALAQPVERIAIGATKTGVDIVLCLDASSSMSAVDMDGSRDRLQVAKAAAASFVTGRDEDRIGLVRFSRYVDAVCPPTRDHEALVRMLDDVPLVERDGPEDATGIGAAVARCVQMLQTAQQTSRAIVLVTDGEENVAAVGTPGEVGPLQAAQAALRHGVRVHALVVGGPAKGATGDLDTSQVEQLAQRTGGAFFRVGDARALAEVYAQIDALERSPVEESFATLEERFAPFVAVALLLWLAAATLRRVGLEVVP